MNTPHKRANIIKAWADGATIQKKNKYTEYEWEDCINTERSTPLFGDPNTDFRIKPDSIKFRVAYFKHGCFVTTSKEVANSWEVDEYFIKWLTPWTEVEI